MREDWKDDEASNDESIFNRRSDLFHRDSVGSLMRGYGGDADGLAKAGPVPTACQQQHGKYVYEQRQSARCNMIKSRTSSFEWHVVHNVQLAPGAGNRQRAIHGTLGQSPVIAYSSDQEVTNCGI